MKHKTEEQLASIIGRQEEIIRLQSGIIDDLFRLLSLHISSEELGALPVIDRMSEAAAVRREMGG